MKTWIRRIVIVLALLVLAVAASVWIGLEMGKRRAARTVKIDPAPVAYRSDEAALQRGAYLYGSRGCVDCHGANGGGRLLVDDGKGLKLAGPNITLGHPKMVTYKEVDWVRSIRHGVEPGGRPLRLMPSEDYNRLSDDDLASLVAHVRALPALGGNLQGVVELPLPGRVMYGFGLIPEAVEKIDHKLPPSPATPAASSAAYGLYVAQMCKGCHGGSFEGGRIPGAPPDWPAAPRLAAGEGSVMARYADAEAFKRMLRSGKRADGSAIGVMPFESLGQLNDNDVAALFAFLKAGAQSGPTR